MALTVETVRKICDIVNKDPDCRLVINSNINSPVLEMAGLAGSVRNMILISGDFIPPLATRSINDMLGRKVDNSKLLCIGITAATSKAILKERKSLPELHSCSAISRIHWGVHHTATWVHMKDDSEFVFDWHATLNIYDPLLSRAADWIDAKGEVFARNFRGFT